MNTSSLKKIIIALSIFSVMGIFSFARAEGEVAVVGPVAVTPTGAYMYLHISDGDVLEGGGGMRVILGTEAENLPILSPIHHSVEDGGDITSGGNFEVSIAGLNPETKYYFDVILTIDPDNHLLATTDSFTTPVATVIEIDSITKTKNSGTIQYNVNTGGLPAHIKMMYGTSATNMDNNEGWVCCNITSTTPVSVPPTTLDGLESATMYYFKMFNENPPHTVYKTGSFTTLNSDGTPVEGSDPVPGANPCTDVVAGEYCLIEPLPGIEKINPKNQDAFADYINKLFNFAIGLGAVLAVVMIVIAGIQYMGTESVFNKGENKSKITGAIMGVLILLGSVILLKTINSDLLNIGTSETISVSIEGVDDVASTVQFEDGTFGIVDAGGNLLAVNGQTAHVGDVWPDDSAMRSALTNAGIEVIGANCQHVGQGTPNFTGSPNTSCTSVYFDSSAQTMVLNTLLALKIFCGCEVKITGGSEIWLHKTHSTSLPIFDFRKTDTFNGYVTGSTAFPSVGQWIERETGRFLPEQGGQTVNTTAPHWHVELIPRDGPPPPVGDGTYGG